MHIWHHAHGRPTQETETIVEDRLGNHQYSLLVDGHLMEGSSGSPVFSDDDQMLLKAVFWGCVEEKRPSRRDEALDRDTGRFMLEGRCISISNIVNHIRDAVGYDEIRGAENLARYRAQDEPDTTVVGPRRWSACSSKPGGELTGSYHRVPCRGPGWTARTFQKMGCIVSIPEEPSDGDAASDSSDSEEPDTPPPRRVQHLNDMLPSDIGQRVQVVTGVHRLITCSDDTSALHGLTGVDSPGLSKVLAKEVMEHMYTNGCLPNVLPSGQDTPHDLTFAKVTVVASWPRHGNLENLGQARYCQDGYKLVRFDLTDPNQFHNETDPEKHRRIEETKKLLRVNIQNKQVEPTIYRRIKATHLREIARPNAAASTDAAADASGSAATTDTGSGSAPVFSGDTASSENN